MNAAERLIGAKPFLKWAGGKRQLIPHIQTVLPENIRTVDDLTYVEPFVGGGAILFWLLQSYPNIKKAVINDINPDLTTAYQVIRDCPGALIQSLETIQETYFSLSSEPARRLFFNTKRDEFNASALDRITRTTLLIFLNRTCFNGLYRVNSSNKFNVPFGRYDRPQLYNAQTLWADSELLQRVTILNGDFAQTLNHIDGPAFFYIDPPYKPLSQTANFNAYAAQDFNDAAQERLAHFCRKLDKQNYLWLLSNSDVTNTAVQNTYFDDLYQGFSIRRIKARRTINSNANRRGEINELLVANYTLSSFGH